MKPIFFQRLVTTMVLVAQVSATLAIGERLTMAAARAATFTCNAGKDGAAGTLSGAYNTYYQPPAGTISTGTTTINLGTIDSGGGGSINAVTAGDELLIVQMQDGTFDSGNSPSYGSGTQGQAGLYEYVQVASLAGSTATIVGSGAGNGLLNSYTEAAATGTSGQKTYQIVRVPQYTTATLSSTFHAAYWDGKTGGVAALDVASTLNLGGASIYATGNGFRGGGVSVASSTPAGVLNNDWVGSATMNGANASTSPPGQGFKGEGIFGTPAYTFEYTSFTTPSTPSSPTVVKTATNGYPNGDVAMGAPGNAGGGGTDGDPVSNDQNTGGGGGGNGGAGGNGGFPWTPQYSGNASLYSIAGVHTAASYSAANSGDTGGRGGGAFTAIASRALLGGGGGAGSNNNGSNNNTFNNYGSSGGVGGGIVMLRIANTSGSAATIYADGTTGLAPNNDGGGGGGAGGTVIVTSPNPFTGITVHADGGAGTTADAGSTNAANQHGPGGGGGGGVVLSTSPVGATVSGGAAGTTANSWVAGDTYGATAGQAGFTSTIDPTNVPGVPSGAECYSSGGSGTATMYTGPADASETTYFGADETGSYDGSVGVSNNNDFTARSIPLANALIAPANTAQTVNPPAGNTFSLSSSATVQVPHELYYANTANGRHRLTLTVQPPLTPPGWTVQICPDNAGTPNCAPVNATCKAATNDSWTIVPASAGATSTVEYCYNRATRNPATVKYWTIYTAPAGPYTAFRRYDGTITAQDDQTTPAQNITHDELYAGFVALAKIVTVTSNNCPSGASVPAIGACPGGTIKYEIDYKNIVAGGGTGNEPNSAFPMTSPGSFVITEDGGAGTSTWGAFSKGLNDVLTNAGVDGVTTFGDTTANSVFASTNCASSPNGNATGSKCFSVQVGGAGFQLVPAGVAGANMASTGTVYFRVIVK
ncbi:MAG: hypothetical protein ACXVAW_10725 [Vulcanimicrobiaceae bacterium]